jgi:hypothetical protein
MRTWLRDLLHPTLPGMDADAVRARPVAFLSMLAVLVLLAVCRYLLGVLDTAAAQGPTVLIGTAAAVLLLVAFHGPAVLRRVGGRTWAMLGVLLVSYHLFWYVGRANALRAAAEAAGVTLLPITAWAWFCLNNVLLLLLPALLGARLLFGWGPGRLGLWARTNPHPPGARPLWPVYLAALVVVLPFVLQAAATPLFTERYPLFREVIGPDNTLPVAELVLCELLYATSFVALEGYFRGVWLFTLEKRLGIYALAFMSVPYVCGHFGKPMPEALGAIAAGTGLGWLALKHRSAWLGAALHVAMAWAMDAVALWGRGTALLP